MRERGRERGAEGESMSVCVWVCWGSRLMCYVLLLNAVAQMLIKTINTQHECECEYECECKSV